MSDYLNTQNPQHLDKLPRYKKLPELQEVLDALPPTYAVWVSPRRKRPCGGLSYADVALVGTDGLAYLIKAVINPDPEVPFNRKEAAIRDRAIDLFRIITDDRQLVFYDADKDLSILNGYVSTDAAICCVKLDLAEAFCEFDEHEQRKAFSFDEAIEKIGISGYEAAHPALTNAARLLHAWFWGIEDYLSKYPLSFQ